MTQAGQYSNLPYDVAKAANLKPFQLKVPEQELLRLSLLLDNCPIAEENWENSREDGRFGVTREWLINAVKYWRHEHNW